MEVIYADLATFDLGEIEDFVGRDSPVSASRVLLEIDAAVQRLVDFPYRGRPGRRRGTRELTTVQPYVIVYRIRPDAITIERIIHGARRR